MKTVLHFISKKLILLITLVTSRNRIIKFEKIACCHLVFQFFSKNVAIKFWDNVSYFYHELNDQTICI